MPGTRIFPTSVPQQAKEVMSCRDGPSTLTVVLALLMVKHQLDGVLSHDLSMEGLMSCLAQSRQKLIWHLQVPELTPTTPLKCRPWLRPFPWAHGPNARDANSCVFHDPEHAAGICLGTIQARTHVQLSLVFPTKLNIQQRLRLTATCVRSNRESGTGMCRSCCCA